MIILYISSDLLRFDLKALANGTDAGKDKKHQDANVDVPLQRLLYEESTRVEIDLQCGW